MEHLILAILTLLFGAVFTLFIKQKYKLNVCAIFTFISMISASMPAITVLKTKAPLSVSVPLSSLFGNVIFFLDPLAAIFVLIISIMSFLGIIYANGYIKPYLNNKNLGSHCFFLMLLIASMLSVTVVSNALFFLVVWELMSLSSFFLVLFEGKKKEVRKASIKYLVYMHLSVIFIMAMFFILSNSTMSLNFADFSKAMVADSHLANLVFILGFIGFGIKAGFVPFHNWLPDAHPSAPSHVSGIMSGVMIKTGIYGILRLVTMTGIPSKFISYLVLIVAAISALYGILYVITQRDIKRFLAYSSIENIGIIGIGMGVGMLGLAYANPMVAIFGFAGGILHILNHSIFKELLFFAAGNVYLKTHTRNMEDLGGLIKKMPYTALMFIIGAIAISGLPLFNGFISEILIYVGMLLGIPASENSLFLTLVIAIAALALVGTMAILCFSKATGIMFLGDARNDASRKVDCDVEATMLLPMGILALATFVIGVYPQYIIKVVLSPVSNLVGQKLTEEVFNIIVNSTQIICLCFVLFLIILVVVMVIRRGICKKYSLHNTWGCGYDRPNSHMQYTASSYANLFVSTLKPLFKRVSHIKKPKDLFPKEAYFDLEIEDIEEAYIVDPIVKLDEKILSKFERIQNGNMQQYILFGLVFLVLSIIGLIIYGGQ